MSVLKGKDVPFKTFDEYKYYQHLTCNTPSQSLVPSSYCIPIGPIMHLSYLVCCLSSLLVTHFFSMDPCNYSWSEKNVFLLPDKSPRHLPPVLLQICKSCKDTKNGFLKTIDQSTAYHRPHTNRPPTTNQPTIDQVHRTPTNRPTTSKKYEDQKFHTKF